jgi:DNA-binding transcriptional regulator PaaX
VLERELAVQLDHGLMCWQLLGDAAGVKANTLQSEILDTLAESFGGECTATDLARFLGKDKSNVRKELVELASRGRLLRGEQKQGREIKYKLPKDTVDRVEK